MARRNLKMMIGKIKRASHLHGALFFTTKNNYLWKHFHILQLITPASRTINNHTHQLTIPFTSFVFWEKAFVLSVVRNSLLVVLIVLVRVVFATIWLLDRLFLVVIFTFPPLTLIVSLLPSRMRVYVSSLLLPTLSLSLSTVTSYSCEACVSSCKVCSFCWKRAVLSLYFIIRSFVPSFA